MLNELINRYPILSECKEQLLCAAASIISAYEKDGKLFICGNGGSAADADHIVGELMKGFLKKRPIDANKKEEMSKRFNDNDLLDKLQVGLPAISLSSISVLNSAFCNDVEPEYIYAQSLFGLANENDILIAISTSGNAKNVAAAAKVAKMLGVTVIGLTGKGGGKLKELSDICICAPESETYKIQELHLPIYHYLCANTEAHFFKI